MVGLALVLTLASTLWTAGYSHKTYHAIVTDLHKATVLKDISETLRELDIMLSYTAARFVVTGEPEWQGQYDVYGAELDTLLQDLMVTYPDDQDDHNSILAITDANDALLSAETRAFAAMAQGNSQEAGHLLADTDYLENKLRYSDGVREFYEEVVATAYVTCRWRHWGFWP